MSTNDDRFLAFRVALVVAETRIDAVGDPCSRYALEQLRLAILELARAQGFGGTLTS